MALTVDGPDSLCAQVRPEGHHETAIDPATKGRNERHFVGDTASARSVHDVLIYVKNFVLPGVAGEELEPFFWPEAGVARDLHRLPRCYDC